MRVPAGDDEDRGEVNAHVRILGSAETEKLRDWVRELEGEVQALRARLTSDGHQRIGTLGEFKRECAKFESLHLRHGIDFSLVVLELADATDPLRSLTPAADRWATGVLLETLRAEDSCYAVDERFVAAVLPATDYPGRESCLSACGSGLPRPLPSTPPSTSL